MFGPVGFTEIVFILILALLIFGPRRLPELGRTLGKGFGEFRRMSDDVRRTLNAEIALDDDEEGPALHRRPEATRRREAPDRPRIEAPREGARPRGEPTTAPSGSAALGSSAAAAGATGDIETGAEAAEGAAEDAQGTAAEEPLVLRPASGAVGSRRRPGGRASEAPVSPSSGSDGAVDESSAGDGPASDDDSGDR